MYGERERRDRKKSNAASDADREVEQNSEQKKFLKIKNEDSDAISGQKDWYSFSLSLSFPVTEKKEKKEKRRGKKIPEASDLWLETNKGRRKRRGGSFLSSSSSVSFEKNTQNFFSLGSVWNNS